MLQHGLSPPSLLPRLFPRTWPFAACCFCDHGMKRIFSCFPPPYPRAFVPPISRRPRGLPYITCFVFDARCFASLVKLIPPPASIFRRLTAGDRLFPPDTGVLRPSSAAKFGCGFYPPSLSSFFHLDVLGPPPPNFAPPCPPLFPGGRFRVADFQLTCPPVSIAKNVSPFVLGTPFTPARWFNALVSRYLSRTPAFSPTSTFWDPPLQDDTDRSSQPTHTQERVLITRFSFTTPAR